MSNMDFLSMSVGKYIQNNLDFAKDIKRPKVFGTNYFLKKDGKYLNGMLDKAVWVKWMELRIHGEAEAIDAGYGLIPKYDDLKKLFKEVRNKDYTEADYVSQFTVRIPELLAKLHRMEKIYETVHENPKAMTEEMAAQRKRLEALKAAKGDYISPAGPVNLRSIRAANRQIRASSASNTRAGPHARPGFLCLCEARLTST